MTTTYALVLLGLLTMLSAVFLGWGFMYLLLEDRHRRERSGQRRRAAQQTSTGGRLRWTR